MAHRQYWFYSILTSMIQGSNYVPVDVELRLYSELRIPIAMDTIDAIDLSSDIVEMAVYES